MCDYSLMGLPNRLATEGERLVSMKRGGHGVVAFVGKPELKSFEMWLSRRSTFWGRIKEIFRPTKEPGVCLVCVPPGAKLQLSGMPENIQRPVPRQKWCSNRDPPRQTNSATE